MGSAVRIAVFGNGFAQRVQLPALRWAHRNGGANEVVGIAGQDLGRARATAEAWGLPRATDDWRTLLEDEPDLVLVTTPVDLHAEMVRAAFEAGAAVLCEKPFTLNAGEAEELCRLAEGRAAWIDHELRWSPLRRRLRELLRGGAIGEPWLVESRMCVGSPRFDVRPYDWRFEVERGGGILGALGSHMVDALRWELGEIEAVRCELRTCQRERKDRAGRLHPVSADDHAQLWLRMASGATAELVISAVRASQHDTWVEVDGSAGALRLVDDERLLLRRRSGDELLEGPSTEFQPVPVEPGLPSAGSVGMEVDGPFARCLPLFLADVVRTVARGATELPGAATFADGLAVQRVLDAARRSAGSDGGWIDCTSPTSA